MKKKNNMCVNSDSKHYEAYYDHVLNKKKSNGSTAKAYDVISLISDKRGLRQTWEEIDGEIQDEIIDELIKIIDAHIDLNIKYYE